MAPAHDQPTDHTGDHIGDHRGDHSAPDLGHDAADTDYSDQRGRSGSVDPHDIAGPPQVGATTTLSPQAAGRSSRTRVIVVLAAVVVAVVAATLWFTRTESESAATVPDADRQAPPSVATSPTSPEAAPSSTSAPDSGDLSAVPPIPPGGVAPVTPPARDLVDPDDVRLVNPPQGEPTATELASPDSAVRAWLARWCPFRYTDEFASPEQRARPAMTEAGWTAFDPSDNADARESWDQTVAARESGDCGAPNAAISPEAPRTDTSAIVIASIDRVITAPGQPAYVEQLSEIRIVKRGTDGLWRVDLPTSGG